jgi:phospho-N-acetylmuramoyl-pentapeptide-transferase
MREASVALALAAISFMLTMIWGEPLLRVLRHLRIGESIRVDGPQRHFAKLGTPTMGGVLFMLPILLITVLLNAANLVGLKGLGRSIFLPLGTMVVFALLGSVDDWQKLRGKRGSGRRGLPARAKLAIQTGLAVVIAIGLRYVLDVPEANFPFLEQQVVLGLWYVPVAAFFIVGFSNAVNLTDGLDGLAGLISATIFAVYGSIAIIQGQLYLARFCFTVVGALFGFLWFNVHPAQLFMVTWVAAAGGDDGGGGADDGAVAAAAVDCNHAGQNCAQLDAAGRLFQTDEGQAFVQDGAAAAPF